ncbi:unnamed protein product [Linum trigynum]|uniref:CCHC-type domain-containing protein n=1 Tax=Linum trigynum TaxID=586398 RepID=A0AAV2C9T7_9ROSI
MIEALSSLLGGWTQVVLLPLGRFCRSAGQILLIFLAAVLEASLNNQHSSEIRGNQSANGGNLKEATASKLIFRLTRQGDEARCSPGTNNRSRKRKLVSPLTFVCSTNGRLPKRGRLADRPGWRFRLPTPVELEVEEEVLRKPSKENEDVGPSNVSEPKTRIEVRASTQQPAGCCGPAVVVIGKSDQGVLHQYLIIEVTVAETRCPAQIIDSVGHCSATVPKPQNYVGSSTKKPGSVLAGKITLVRPTSLFMSNPVGSGRPVRVTALGVFNQPRIPRRGADYHDSQRIPRSWDLFQKLFLDKDGFKDPPPVGLPKPLNQRGSPAYLNCDPVPAPIIRITDCGGSLEVHLSLATQLPKHLPGTWVSSSLKASFEINREFFPLYHFAPPIPTSLSSPVCSLSDSLLALQLSTMVHAASDQVVAFSLEEVQSDRTRCAKTLLGRLFTDHNTTLTELRDSINTPWQARGRVIVRLAAHGLFEFVFPNQTARNWVLQRTPWVVDDKVLHLCAWTPSITRRTFDELAFVPFRVQLWDVQDDCCTQQFGRKVAAATLGRVLETGVFLCTDSRRKFVKVKAVLDFSKPLRSQVLASNEEIGEFWIRFKYEFLPTLCYHCGRLGHSRPDCSFDPPSRTERFGNHMTTKKMGKKLREDGEDDQFFPHQPASVWKQGCEG